MPGAFKYTPSHEVDARHRAAKAAKVSPHETRLGETKNVQSILALGNTRYFTYRDILFRIPPVSYKLGQQVLVLYSQSMAQAKKVTSTGDEKAMQEYYLTLSMLVELMWKHVEPGGRFRRVLKRLHLLKNIFRIASEKEVTELTGFFLQCRMMSTVQVTEEGSSGSLIPMSSTSSKSS